MRWFSILVAFWGAFLTNAPQQPSPPDRPTLSIETDLVTLSVTVVDGRGGFVPGLTRERFTVYDNDVVQNIQFVAGGDRPATIGLIVDASGSMRSRVSDLLAAVSAFTGIAAPSDEFFTLRFNETVWLALPPGTAFTTDHGALRASLAQSPASGLTALYDALERALAHIQQSAHDRRVLIVVSDGGDNASAIALENVVEQLRRSGVIVYAVLVSDPDNRDARPGVLKTVARESGGELLEPANGPAMTTAFERIAEAIRSSYTIGYPAPGGGEERFHRVRVVVTGAGHERLTARTRAGYYASRTRPGLTE